MTSNNTVDQNSPYSDLPPDKVAQLRAYIRQNAGTYGMATISNAIRQKYGYTAQQVMEPNPGDFWRTVAQGVTLGHYDELKGLAAKLSGGDYTQARDAIRTQDAEFGGAGHRLLQFATEGVAGGIPGTLASPLAGIEAGATGANILRGGALGLASGAVAGEGNSNAPTAGGIGKDAALGAGIGGLLGAGGSAIASKLASAGSPFGNAAPVATEAAAQIPGDTGAQQGLIMSLTRQEDLAPGTVVLADQSPNMQKFAAAVGADRTTAMKAADDAAQRVTAIKGALKNVGQDYDLLPGQKVQADAPLKQALDEIGRRDLIKGDQVDLGDLHDLRGQLLKTARRTTDASVANDKRGAANMITDWMSQQAPWLKQTDTDYAFLTNRLDAAKQTQKTVQNSLVNYAKARAMGNKPVSFGASLQAKPQGVGTTILSSVNPFKTDPGKRAQAIAQLLLSPQRDQTGLQGLIATHDALLQAPPSPLFSLPGALGAGAQATASGGATALSSPP